MITIVTVLVSFVSWVLLKAVMNVSRVNGLKSQCQCMWRDTAITTSKTQQIAEEVEAAGESPGLFLGSFLCSFLVPEIAA